MLVLILLVIAPMIALGGRIDLSNASIVVLNPKRKIMTNAGDMLLDEIEKRTRITLQTSPERPGNNQPVIVIGLGNEIRKDFPLPAGLEMPFKADGYAIWIDTKKRAAPTICLAGVDERGALFAAGRLLRLLDMDRDTLSLDSEIKIATAPKIGLRGHQLSYRPKTNSYDAWTIEMWEQYYRDMVVFGMNAVELLPPRTDDDADSPHFPTLPMEMMVRMSQLADDYGLDVWIWFPAIGAPGSNWRAINREYTYKESVDASLKEWGEVFGKLPRLDTVFVPGGDPGRTHPTVLLSLIEKQKKNLNKYHPKARIWVSPQGFDRTEDREGWLKIFLDILQNDKPAWLDGVVFGPQVMIPLPELREKVPVQYPIRRYPDITHCDGGCQYEVPDWDKAFHRTLDREPVNPRPLGYAEIFREIYRYSIGFITYSEGCNDDFNKVLWSCLGWDPDMNVKDITKEYSRYFISRRYEESFSQGLLGLEQNWVGPVKDNEGIYETLKLFQEMEKNATPQDKLNWRFQQGLYRAYYDAYVKVRLHYESDLETQAFEVLKKAKEIGAIKAIDQAESILNKAVTEKTMPQWRARTFELAEALYQSIRMQLSVPKYKAIRVVRGANLDNIDVPLNNRSNLKKRFDGIRKKTSEEQRLKAIQKTLDKRHKSRAKAAG